MAISAALPLEGPVPPVVIGFNKFNYKANSAPAYRISAQSGNERLSKIATVWLGTFFGEGAIRHFFLALNEPTTTKFGELAGQ